MKIKYKMILVLFITFIFYGCNNNNILQPEDDITRTFEMTSAQLFEEEVKQSLLDLVEIIYPEIIDEVYNALEADNKFYYTIDILEYLYPEMESLSSLINSDVENLFAIYNFDNENGYAIVAADENMEEDIIFITNKGEISLEDFEEDFFIACVMDDEVDPLAYITTLVNQYALDLADTEFWSRGVTYCRPCSYLTDYMDAEQYGPLVKINLGQDYPFNMYAESWLGYSYASLGCTSVAVAGIVSANKYPYKFDGISFNWDDIIAAYPAFVSSEYATITTNISHLFWIMAIISSDCKTFRTSKYGMSLPFGGYACLEDYYLNVKYEYDISYDNLFNMISHGQPVFVYGCDFSNWGIHAHSWIIDGILTQSREKECWINENSSYTTTVYRNLIHHNFGWRGQGNGYFNLNVYELSLVEILDDKSTIKVRDYNCDNKLIVYDI